MIIRLSGMKEDDLLGTIIEVRSSIYEVKLKGIK